MPSMSHESNGNSLCYRGGLTEHVINMLTSPVWASHRPALSYADTNSRLNICASHGFHMSRYRCHSQLRTPGITFYPGKLAQPNESFHPGSARKLHSPSYSAYSLHCQFCTMSNLILWFYIIIINHVQHQHLAWISYRTSLLISIST